MTNSAAIGRTPNGSSSLDSANKPAPAKNGPDNKLLQKLELVGIRGLALQLFQSYLLGRRLAVVVDGCSSAPLKIGNSVYQGVVLGPFFWNLFFRDFSIPLKEAGFRKFCFADDGNAAKFFPCGTSFSEIFQSASECQSNYWRWGGEHRIVFDKKKEFLVVLLM